MTFLQAIWLVASFFIGFSAIEFAVAAIRSTCGVYLNLLGGLLGVLIAYTIMFGAMK